MDTSGFCQFGRNGTLSLLKRQSADIADEVLTSFGIDDQELTFGSSMACSIRLYYQDVDSLHCKIFFELFKAFLAVFGSSGVIVDGCRVFPHTSGDSLDSAQTIIPLNNDSIFEIHGKRFKFRYPPKEIRNTSYITPARPPQRALRLSMIHSAQVFSPRPSNDPRENLRILKSPRKKPSSPVKNSSPLKSSILPEMEEEIVLVHTNHPRVVEEENDLVILEDIPVKFLSPIKPILQQVDRFPLVQPQLQPPSTPSRRSLGGTALHRAVLIRSAQRAVLKAEKEREEVEEELEVVGSVVSRDDGDDDPSMRSAEAEDVEMFDVEDEDEGEETDSEEEHEQEGQTQKSLWRKSLEKIMPWSLSDPEVEGEGLQEAEDDGEMEMFPPIVSSSGPLRPFMTPQPQHRGQGVDSDSFHSTRLVAPAGRFSLGGQAGRVIVEQPWKIQDLVLPPPTTPLRSARSLMPSEPTSPTTIILDGPRAGTPRGNGSKSSTGTVGKPEPITEEERKAIQERRKSALKDFNSTPFWAGGAPGMSPMKVSRNSSNIFSPSKTSGTFSPSKRFTYDSPAKLRPSEPPIAETVDESDEDMDASGLLHKIKETVSDMKRRRSMILGGHSTAGTPQSVRQSDTPLTEVSTSFSRTSDAPLKRIDFTKVSTPTKVSKNHQTPKTSPRKDNTVSTEDRLLTPHQGEPFSLLRPGALQERRQSVAAIPSRNEPITVVPVPVIAVDDQTRDCSDDLSMDTVAPGSTLMLRSDTSILNKSESSLDVGMEDSSGNIKLNVMKSPRMTRQRSKTPQPHTIDAEVSQNASETNGGRTIVEELPIQLPEQTDEVEKTNTNTKSVRKASTPATSNNEAKTTQSGPKRGRPRRNPRPIENLGDEIETLDRSVDKSTDKLRSGTRKKLPAKRGEVDSEDDPLDSYEIEELQPESSTGNGENQLPVVNTTKKTETPVAKRKTASRIKAEASSEETSLPVATTRVGRRTKATEVTPSAKTVKSKTRGRPKTPATAPANTGGSIAEEKENTVALRSRAKTTDKVPNPEAEDPPKKLRISRSRGASSAKHAAKLAAAADDDDDEPSVPPPPTRQMTRVTRTRTKTG